MGNTSSLLQKEKIQKAIIKHKYTKISRLLKKLNSHDDFLSFINRPIDYYNDTMLDLSLLSCNYVTAEELLDIDGINVSNVTRGGITTLMCLFIGLYKCIMIKNRIELSKYKLLSNTVLRIAKKIIKLGGENIVISPDDDDRTALDYLLDFMDANGLLRIYSTYSSDNAYQNEEIIIKLARLLLKNGADIMHKSSGNKVIYLTHFDRLNQADNTPIFICGTGFFFDILTAYNYSKRVIWSIERAFYGGNLKMIRLLLKMNSMCYIMEKMHTDTDNSEFSDTTMMHIIESLRPKRLAWIIMFRNIRSEVQVYIIQKYKIEIDNVTKEIQNILPQPIVEELEEYNIHRMIIQLCESSKKYRLRSDSSIDSSTDTYNIL